MAVKFAAGSSCATAKDAISVSASIVSPVTSVAYALFMLVSWFVWLCAVLRATIDARAPRQVRVRAVAVAVVVRR